MHTRCLRLKYCFQSSSTTSIPIVSTCLPVLGLTMTWTSRSRGFSNGFSSRIVDEFRAVALPKVTAQPPLLDSLFLEFLPALLPHLNATLGGRSYTLCSAPTKTEPLSSVTQHTQSVDRNYLWSKNFSSDNWTCQTRFVYNFSAITKISNQSPD